MDGHGQPAGIDLGNPGPAACFPPQAPLRRPQAGQRIEHVIGLHLGARPFVQQALHLVAKVSLEQRLAHCASGRRFLARRQGLPAVQRDEAGFRMGLESTCRIP